MSTAGALILSAFQMVGYYGANETMNGADSALGLQQLNMMLDSWSNESLTCFAITEQSVVLTPNKATYSIGTTGSPDINATRPIRLIEGFGAAYIQDSNSNNYLLEVVPQDKWNQISNRGSATVSNIPDTLFYDPQFPLGKLNFWPTPNQGGFTAFWDSYLQLGNMATVSTSFSLPPGYELAIQSNLALQLAPFVKNAVVSDDVKRIARDSKANIKRSNKRNTQATFDREIISTAQPTFNIYTGKAM